MEKIKSLEKIVEELEIAENRLTTSINTLKLEKETLGKEVEKIKREKILIGKAKEAKEHSRLLTLSVKRKDKEQQITSLNKKAVSVQKELGDIELLLAEKRSLSKTIIHQAQGKAKEIVSATEQIKEQNDNLEAQIQSNKHLLVSMETDIKNKETELKKCLVELRATQEQATIEKENLNTLAKQARDFLKNKPNVLHAEQVVRDVRENKLKKDQLEQEIIQLKDKKGGLKDDIIALAEVKKDIEKDRREITEIKGALMEKETGLNQRVAFLKDMYGELNLPW